MTSEPAESLHLVSQPDARPDARPGAQPDPQLDPRIVHAQAVYTRGRLAIYDKLVLGLFCSLVWRCPASEMRRLYDRSVGQRHLDIGPGTGYFVDRCHFPADRPEITLLDLSAECLDMSLSRLARYRPAVCQANLMYPLPLPSQHFDSAAMNLVFHTIPGGWAGKGIILKHVAQTLKPGGILFGTTVLAQGVPMNRLTRHLLAEQHKRGNFQNQGDDPDGLRRELAKYFPQSRVTVRGSTAIFEATAG
jgi:SAM-dependent methyltransferase